MAKTKYDLPKLTKFQYKFCKDLVDHMTTGLSYASFAGVVGVNRDTLYQWEKRYPEWKLAKEIGWEKSRLYWDKRVLRMDGSAHMLEYNTQNRFPDQWGAKAQDPIAKDKTVIFAYPEIKKPPTPKTDKKPKPIKEVADVKPQD